MTTTAHLTTAFQLRPYQQSAVDSVVNHFLDRNVTRPLIVLPTGSGKTICFAALLKHRRLAVWMSSYDGQSRKMLVLAHREELIMQAADKIRASDPDLYVDIEKPISTHRPVRTWSSSACKPCRRAAVVAYKI